MQSRQIDPQPDSLLLSLPEEIQKLILFYSAIGSQLTFSLISRQCHSIFQSESAIANIPFYYLQFMEDRIKEISFKKNEVSIDKINETKIPYYELSLSLEEIYLDRKELLNKNEISIIMECTHLNSHHDKKSEALKYFKEASKEKIEEIINSDFLISQVFRIFFYKQLFPHLIRNNFFDRDEKVPQPQIQMSSTIDVITGTKQKPNDFSYPIAIKNIDLDVFNKTFSYLKGLKLCANDCKLEIDEKIKSDLEMSVKLVKKQ